MAAVTAAKMDLFSWVRPEVVVEAAFNEWTGALRHAELVRVVGLNDAEPASVRVVARVEPTAGQMKAT
jgi:hypothetical protein